ncbi:MAG: hypothetical protein PG981_000898 [Wolbachia endosymbiont of Ctenocephalides orientis wCori]|nr:MAG: hypothetical protein PG981_000898 [Wolbachia endosymbiont of Ctenocephalides orientis wCori]
MQRTSVDNCSALYKMGGRGDGSIYELPKCTNESGR